MLLLGPAHGPYLADSVLTQCCLSCFSSVVSQPGLPSITEVQARSTNAWRLMHEGLDPDQSVPGRRLFFLNSHSRTCSPPQGFFCGGPTAVRGQSRVPPSLCLSCSLSLSPGVSADAGPALLPLAQGGRDEHGNQGARQEAPWRDGQKACSSPSVNLRLSSRLGCVENPTHRKYQ